ncbi:hypothetical protein [Porphyromonas cangingivalis]|uniref:Uncharacterized protein n=1 Tax=Porphyromonas cangingivalis TaxID=36874 RepID=A0A1T4LE57_PORCN|nr:hypothetical protein [Porphyromonas cangingivalis]SJZ52896.1 hypothetical protein SAMN02745205_01111 [Porphyromonas cangingivalis]VEJ02169.1 Uncharacterised protein [Porphyromonas cangingivalis]
MKLIEKEDYAHNLLIPFIAKTQELLEHTLKSIDFNAECRITPAVDLGFPHDVIRIAGGFPTGAFVEWKCNTPFIPIDTTVNIDTSSIFYLDDDITDSIDENTFSDLRGKIENSSYVFNFHKGNHFISFGHSVEKNCPVLVIHSNEKEFKYQFNGLMPAKENWYADDINIYQEGNRYIRYLKGDKAELFIDIAKMLEDFNIIRHRFIAHLLTHKRTKINHQFDKHHYYMPTRNSVAIGCFIISEGEEVPIFSKVGKDIFVFKPLQGGANKIITLNEKMERLIVPHGWGKTCEKDVCFEIDLENKQFYLSGKSYPIEPLISLGKDERLSIRNFSSDPTSPESIFSQMQQHCPGVVVERIIQKSSYTKYGFQKHF